MQTKGSRTANALYESLAHIAHHQAKRLGLNQDDAEDYVSNFLLKCLQLDPDCSIVYLIRAGHNAALDYLRSDCRIHRWERLFSPTDATDLSSSFSLRLKPSDEVPHIHFLVKEFRFIVGEAVTELSAEQQTIWRLLIIEERSAIDVSLLMGRSPHAVRQAMTSIRKHLRTILARHGFDANTAQEYFCEFGKSHTG